MPTEDNTDQILIRGQVSPGFEPVRALFERGFHRGQEANAQLCVYHKGVKVVDLYGTALGDVQYGPDTLQTIFSSTKSVTALVFATLIDRGLLTYTDLVSTHWPEFAAHGKAAIRVCDVLRHEAGLVHLAGTITKQDMLPEATKQNRIGALIERSPAVFPPEEAGTRREYHALTRGFILNEIFRRVDPQGRTMGEYLREEISPLLEVDVFLGLTDTQLSTKDVSDLRRWTVRRVAMESMVPKRFGRKTDASSKQLFTLLRRLRNKQKESAVKRPPAIEGLDKVKTNDFVPMFNGQTIRKGETPSGNGICSARGLARLGSAAAAGGALPDGRRLLSEETCQLMHDGLERAKDNGSTGGMLTEFSQGGLNLFRSYPGEDSAYASRTKPLREGFFGWMGFGGSVFQWRPDIQLSFAYTPTLMHWYDLQNARGARLQQVVVKCIEDLELNFESTKL